MILLFINIEIKNQVNYNALIVLFLTFIFGNEWEIFWKRIFKTSLYDPLKNYSNLECIFIYDKRWKTISHLLECGGRRLIKFIKDIHIISETFSQDNMNELILMVLKELKININKLIKFFPKINFYE